MPSSPTKRGLTALVVVIESIGWLLLVLWIIAMALAGAALALTKHLLLQMKTRLLQLIANFTRPFKRAWWKLTAPWNRELNADLEYLVEQVSALTTQRENLANFITMTAHGTFDDRITAALTPLKAHMDRLDEMCKDFEQRVEDFEQRVEDFEQMVDDFEQRVGDFEQANDLTDITQAVCERLFITWE